MLEIPGFATPNSLRSSSPRRRWVCPIGSFPSTYGAASRGDAFTALNPNGKVPVVIDRAPAAGGNVILSESAAILVYLAEKVDRLIPTEAAQRGKVFEQLFFHASGLSPAFLQAFLLAIEKEPSALAKEAALREVDRVLTILDGRLERHRYVAGDEYTIADIAHFGWIWRHTAIGARLDKFDFVNSWQDEILSRPAVASAIRNTVALAA